MRRLAAALAVITIACGGTTEVTTSPPPPSPTTAAATTVPFPATSLPAGYELTAGRESLHGDGWSATVPALGLRHPQPTVAAAVDEALADLMTALVDGFVAGGGSGTLEVEHEVTFMSVEALSVRFLSRGPGLLLVDTASFDLIEGRPLGLTDVLVGVNSILLVSDLVTAALVAEVHGGDPAALAEYTAAVNPRRIAYSPAGLEVSFDPGEVAAAESGVVTVLVPWDDVAEFIHPEGPFAALRPDG